eukprot:gnl/TRDRNA2_/TRDRNA2_191051_c0_seq1.p1 gnl/TRDRNA2_/TRDRNA2_191051_c0~~gnl/TRDRNA2_/TRDRNA2_191051_c0_seq1.p1  ORF type:complete len:690 (+),score=127.24 gnl/TRDRNA2_/TRDRNA2_191051_c0_seq1:113-2071(+)
MASGADTGGECELSESPPQRVAARDGASDVQLTAEDSWALDDSSAGQGAGTALPVVQAHAVPVPEKPSARAYTLVQRGAFDEALKVLETAPELWHEVQNPGGHTFLHWAALAGKISFIRRALEVGLQVDVESDNKQTPLMWACINGHLPAARFLMQAKACPRKRDSMGATPLILSVQHRQHPQLLMLMQLADREKVIAEVDDNGCGAVHWAAYKGDIVSLRLLDYFEASFETVDSQRMTPLHRAVQAAQMPSVLEFLLDKKVDPALRNSDNENILDMVVRQQDKGLERALNKLVEGGEPAGGAVGEVIQNMDDELEAGTAQAAAPKSGRRGRLRRKQKEDTMRKIIGRQPVCNPGPICWLVCTSLAIFQYLNDIRTVSWTVAPSICLAFELGVPMSLALFFYVMYTDPGKLPARIKGNSGVEELMKALDSLPADSPVDAYAGLPGFDRLCTTTWVMKGLRTKYCKNTGACVEEFDHYCGWLACAIGRANHRPFIALAAVEVSTQFCHLYLLWKAGFQLVEWTSFGTWIGTLAMLYPLLIVMTVVHAFSSPGVFFLLLAQLRMIAINLTTNESINAFRYDHFWDKGAEGQKAFKNPFDKGGMAANCLDFWWIRRRGERGTTATEYPMTCKMSEVACRVGKTGTHAGALGLDEP